jgi:hypothetical protein
MLESDATGQPTGISALGNQLHELKGENARLRKSLALLHAYSLLLREQRDTLMVERDQFSGAYRAVATPMRDDLEAHDPFADGGLDLALRLHGDLQSDSLAVVSLASGPFPVAPEPASSGHRPSRSYRTKKRNFFLAIPAHPATMAEEQGLGSWPSAPQMIE